MKTEEIKLLEQVKMARHLSVLLAETNKETEHAQKYKALAKSLVQVERLLSAMIDSNEE